MLEEQEKYLDDRAATGRHAEHISTKQLPSRLEGELRRYVASAFAHHVMQNLPSFDEVDEMKNSAARDMTRDQVHILFHLRYYQQVKIRLGTGPEGVEISQAEFEDRILRRAIQSQNNVCFLVGGIGQGKTSFIINQIIQHGRRWYDNEGYYPVRVDFDISTNGDEVPEKGKLILKNVVEGILLCAEKSGLITNAEYMDILKKVLPAGRNFSIVTEERYEQFVVDVIQRIRRYGSEKKAHGSKLPFLILDNIDFLFHVCDRGIFADSEPDDAIKVNELISYVISTFLRRFLSSVGMPVLIVLRPDSRLMLELQLQRLPEIQHQIHESTFWIEAPEPSVVVEKHADLLEEIIAQTPSTPNNQLLLSAAQKLRINISSAFSAQGAKVGGGLGEVAKLSKQGLRHLIEYCGNWIWLPIQIAESAATSATGAKYEVRARFTDHKIPTQLVFMLNGRRLFSQGLSSFPNVYLVRSECYGKVDASRIPASLLGRHRHTYWLKRLLLEYISARNATGKRVDKKRILDVFSPPSLPPDQCYEPSIVKLVLGSLYHVAQSNLIDYEPTHSFNASGVEPGQINLTQRGRFFLSGGVDSFAYLQLVIDDPLLPLPDSVVDYFTFKKPCLDYGYLIIPDQASYHEAKNQLVEMKLERTLCFLDIVNEALKLEMAQYPIVFKNLKESKVRLPNPLRVKEQLLAHRPALFRWLSDKALDRIQDRADREYHNALPSLQACYAIV